MASAHPCARALHQQVADQRGAVGEAHHVARRGLDGREVGAESVAHGTRRVAARAAMLEDVEAARLGVEGQDIDERSTDVKTNPVHSVLHC